MKRALALAFSTCAVVVGMSSAVADWSLGAGFENFRWKESTSPAVKESGLRWALDLGWVQSREPGLSAAYEGKYYMGNVDYNGSFLGTTPPLSGTTHYRGFSNEIQSVYRMPQNALDFVLAAGWDHWTRKLSTSQEETWEVLFARLGVNVNSGARTGPFASAGFKYPVYVRENLHLTDNGFNQNPRVRPRGDFSVYGTLGYRVTPAWDVMAYYDSYRFSRSNSVIVSNSTSSVSVSQPKSRQDELGLRVRHNF